MGHTPTVKNSVDGSAWLARASSDEGPVSVLCDYLRMNLVWAVLKIALVAIVNCTPDGAKFSTFTCGEPIRILSNKVLLYCRYLIRFQIKAEDLYYSNWHSSKCIFEQNSTNTK